MPRSKKNWAIIGLGFISLRHIQAIEATGNKLLMACDLDKDKAHKAGNAKFFTNWKEMIDSPEFEEIDYVSICTPNYLHFEMALECAKKGKRVIVEKPPILTRYEARILEEYEDKISCIVQLRYNPELQRLRKSLDDDMYDAEFSVCVHRDESYLNSWKNDKSKSGGLLFNIGVHYFDLLVWFFGGYMFGEITEHTDKMAEGTIGLLNANAKWKLSIDQPLDNQYRYLKINGVEVDLTKNFEGLHTKAYKDILKGNGIKISEITDTINLINNLYETK